MGEPSDGYDLLLPLGEDSRIDAAGWKANQEACRVRQFTDDATVAIGRLRR